MTVAELLAALASPDPTPGGGTAAAIAGAMGTSLLVMVAGLAKSKNNTDDEKAALANARAAIEPITSRLTELADADTAAFDAVMAAYRLPKATDEEKAARTQRDSGGAARRHRGSARNARARAPTRSRTRASSPITAIDRRQATSAWRSACSRRRRPAPPPTCGSTWGD